MLRVNIATSATDGIAEVDLWYSTLYDFDVDILLSLKEYLVKFEDSINFNLRVKSKPCLACQQLVSHDSKDCISHGKYCPIAPTSNK